MWRLTKNALLCLLQIKLEQAFIIIFFYLFANENAVDSFTGDIYVYEWFCTGSGLVIDVNIAVLYIIEKLENAYPLK